MNEIKDSIRKLATPNHSAYSVVCTVDSVDVGDLTCYCIPINGDADLVGVRLMADVQSGFLLTPKVGSIVVVAFLTDSSSYVSMVSQVSEVQLNGKNFDGLVKINELTAKLNQLKTEITAQLALIATGISAGGGSYAPGVLSTFVKSDYENTTIKQGNGN